MGSCSEMTVLGNLGLGSSLLVIIIIIIMIVLPMYFSR